MRRRRKKRRPPGEAAKMLMRANRKKRTAACSKLQISTRFKCFLQLFILLIQIVNLQAQLSVSAPTSNQTVIARASETDQRREWSPVTRGEGRMEKDLKVGRQFVLLEATESLPQRQPANGREKRQAQQDKFDAKRQFSDAADLRPALSALPPPPPTLVEQAANLAANLPAGSRLVASSAGQSVELTCNALDAALSAARDMQATNQKGDVAETSAKRQIGHRRRQQQQQLEFVVGADGSLVALDDGELAGESFQMWDRSNRTQKHQQQQLEMRQLLTSGLLLDANEEATDEELAEAGSSWTSLSRHLNHLNVHDYLVALVFWYKDSNPAPIYTLDARPITSQVLAASSARKQTDGSRGASSSSRLMANAATVAAEKLNEISKLNGKLLAQARHYRSQRLLEGQQTELAQDGDLPATAGHQQASQQQQQQQQQQQRAVKGMSIAVDWPLIRLRLESVDVRHAGDFRCRVDFRRARTIRQLVRLLVEAPMKRLELDYSTSGQASDSLREQSDRNQSAFQPEALANNVSADEANNLLEESSASGAQQQVRMIRLNEGAEVDFECRAIEGAPRAQLSWLVAWPQRAAGQPLEDPVASWQDARLLDINSPLWSAMGARSGAPEPRDNWLNRSAPADPRKSANAIRRLQVSRLARVAHRLRLGCRARQVLQFSATDARSKLRSAARANYQPASEPGSQEANLAAGQWAPADGQSRNNWQHSAPKPQDEAARAATADDDHETGRKRLIPAQGELMELTKWVELELNLKPELVEILQANRSLTSARRSELNDEIVMKSAGQQQRVGHPIKSAPEVVSIESRQQHQATSFVCRTRGSLPAASSHWFWAAERPGEPETAIEESERVRIVVSSGGSASELVFVGGLGAGEHLRKLACRATNSHFSAQISDRSLEVHVQLNVKFKPVVRLLGERVEARAQLKLQCNVQSNPAINQLVWLVSGRILARVALINKRPIGSGESDGAGQAHSQAAEVELFGQAEIKRFRVELDEQLDRDKRAPAPRLVHFEHEQASYQLDLSQLLGHSNGAERGRYLANQSVQLDVKLLSRQMSPNERPARDKIKLSKWPPADGGNGGIATDSHTNKDITFQCSATSAEPPNDPEQMATASDTLRLAAAFDNSKCLVGQRLESALVSSPSSRSTSSSIDDKTTTRLADGLLDSIQAHQAPPFPVQRLVCHRGRGAGSSHFLWSFVPAERVELDAEGQLSGAAIERQLETNSSELADVSQLVPSNAGGLVLCQEFVALRAEWQRAPCIILLANSSAPDEESHVPDARNCQVEPLLVEGREASDGSASESFAPTRLQIPVNAAAGQLGDGLARDDDDRRLVISVDCGRLPAASGGEAPALILAELAVGWSPQATAQRKELGRDNRNGPPAVAANGSSSGSSTTTFETFALFKKATDDSLRPRPFQRLVDFNALLGRVGTTALPASDPDYAKLRKTTTNEQQQQGVRQQQTAEPNGSERALLDAVGRKRPAGELDNEEAAAAARPAQGAASGQLQGDQATDELNGSSNGNGTSARKSLGANETRMKLSEQVALLNELEFTLRLGDLIHAPSERRIIKGAQMKLLPANQEQQQQEASPRYTHDQKSLDSVKAAKTAGAAQVSRSASSQLAGLDELDDDSQPVLVAAAGAPTNSSLGSHRGTLHESYNYRTTLLDWGRRHEIGVTLAAIGATLTLSLLTLTLIILVVRSRQSAVSSPPPSFVSTTTTTAGTTASANNQANSSPSNSNETNSAGSTRQSHLQHEHQLRHFLLTQADPAPSSVSSYSSPAPAAAGALHDLGPEPEYLAAPFEHGQPRLLDLRHFRPAGGSARNLGKQLVFDCDGLIVMSECSMASHEHEDLDLDSVGNYHATEAGNFYQHQVTASHNLSNSLQESCISVTETTISPTTIDFLAPPATSCHSNQGTMRRNQHYDHHQQPQQRL